MIEVEIHYTIDGFDDYYVLSGDTIEEIKKQNELEMKKRNLDDDKNFCWSRTI